MAYARLQGIYVAITMIALGDAASRRGIAAMVARVVGDVAVVVCGVVSSCGGSVLTLVGKSEAVAA